MSVVEALPQAALYRDTLHIRVAIGGGSIVVRPAASQSEEGVGRPDHLDPR